MKDIFIVAHATNNRKKDKQKTQKKTQELRIKTNEQQEIYIKALMDLKTNINIIK